MPDLATRGIRIGEDDGRAALMVDDVVQSISPHDSDLDGGYWAAMLPRDRPRNALVLGMGGGTLAGLLVRRWGEMRIVGIEDDPAVLSAAEAAGWLPAAGVEVVIADAFEYVQTCHERFDYVAVDLFRGGHLVGRAFGKPFLRRLRHLLHPRAQLAFNVFSDLLLPMRLERLATFFDIRDQVGVGGNVIVHARGRRRG